MSKKIKIEIEVTARGYQDQDQKRAIISAAVHEISYQISMGETEGRTEFPVSGEAEFELTEFEEEV